MPLAANAANPVLTIQGTGNTSPDVTAFVDQLEIVRVSDNMVMAGAVGNASFETFSGMSNGNYGYNPTAAPWSFNTRSGIAVNGSAFGAPTAPAGSAVAFVQSTAGSPNGQLQQTLTLADGVYQLRFQVAQRNCCSSNDQRLNVLINGVQVGTVQPANNGQFSSYTTSSFVVGSPNNALRFDGIDDNVSIPHNAAFNLTTALTIESWIRPVGTGQATQNVVCKSSNSQNTGYIFPRTDDTWNSLRIWLNRSGNWSQYTVPYAANIGTWHHVAATYDGTTVRMYIDGVQMTPTASGAVINGPITTNTNPQTLGTQPGFAENYRGDLDEVRVYNAVLSQAQIQADMYSSASALPGSQVAYYTFDQGTAGGNNAGQTTLNDQSGNGRTGTLNGFGLSGTASNWVRSFPTITSLTPSSGPRGSSVLVGGTNLLDATGMAFNNTAVAPFTTPTDDYSATVTVPAAATTGAVSVSSALLSRFNGPVFTVVTDLVVSTTMTIPAGNYNSITITGTGVGTLGGPVTVASGLTVQAGGVLNDGCSTIGGTGTFTLAAGSTLGICSAAGISSSGATGSVQVSGTRSFSTDASYVYNGTAAQSTGSGLPSQVRSLTTTNSSAVTLTAPVAVSQMVTVGSTGNLSLNGQTLTLLSSASGTAMVVNGSTGIVSGSALVQRYIDPSLNPGAGYRHFSSPVQSTTFADLAAPGFTPLVNPAYNTSATPALVTPFPNVFGYNQARLATATNDLSGFDKGWFSPGSLSDPMLTGRGYTVNIPASSVVDFGGALSTGNSTLTLARNAAGTANDADAGWHLVGNPYPSPLNYSLVAPADRTNLDAAIYVFSSTSQYGGTYRSYVNGIGGNPVLPVAQGFFVRVSSGQTSGSLTFRNSQRLTTADATAFQRTSADSRARVQLELRSSTGTTDVFDAYAEAGADAGFLAQYDAMKLPNTNGLSLASLSAGNELLAIDGRPAFAAGAVLPLVVNVPAAGTYSLTAAILANLPAGIDAYLTDALTGQAVALRQLASYSFAVTASQAAGPVTGRFALAFRSQTALANTAGLTAAQVSLYPNPAHAAFTVQVPAVAGTSKVEAQLLNALGQVVRSQSAVLTAAGAGFAVDASGLSAGVYTLRLHAGTSTLTKRVVLH
ncbi:hypothetical protein GCM10023185_01430 [Hymenobacter saemangeumensis]|uniref:LamG-like jellyroll fold domain-containing protein n=1 Tax=Hymenobacter saemangeumensis TaxID=1084522 RepID=A0ABP8HXC3_9BACT